jgi:hypothetical protein
VDNPFGLIEALEMTFQGIGDGTKVDGTGLRPYLIEAAPAEDDQRLCCPN